MTLYIRTLTEIQLFLYPIKKKKSEVAQSCPTLCDPMDYSLPGSSVHGTFQARLLEWVATSFSRRSSQSRDWNRVYCVIGRRFTVWANREALLYPSHFLLQLQMNPKDSLENFKEWLEKLVRVPGTDKRYSVQFSYSVVSDSWWPHEPQHARPSCPSPTPRVYPNPCPLSRWCHPAISSSAVPFSSCPQSFPALGSFPMSQLFAWGGQSVGVSASTSVPPMNTQDLSPLGWTGWISSQSKGFSRVFNTTVQKHQFFSAQLSSQSTSHIHTWLLEKP